MSDFDAAIAAVAAAGQGRCDLVERPIRDALEAIGYGYAALVAEAEARGWTVTLESQWHIMIWRETPRPYAKANNVYDPARGELIGSWLDGPNWSLDHLARCLRAEMAVLCTWPAGWERQRLEAALAAASPKDQEADQ